MCVCVHTRMCVHAHTRVCTQIRVPWHVDGSQRTTCRSQFSPSTIGLEAPTQVISVGSRHYYPLSHLAAPLISTNIQVSAL